jgi:DNA-binding CsgD family transcriptional regulator
MDREFLKKCLAEGLSLERIGKLVDRNPSTISYHLKKHGLEPANKGRHANKGPIPRDVLEALVAEGLSFRQMAVRLDRSPATIRHWIVKYGLRTSGMGLRRRELAAAREAGLKRVTSRCRHHGETEFVLENRGYYRCARCRAEKVSQWRRRAKLRLVEAAGGVCVLCGYDRYPGALQFHHLDPGQKEFAISRQGVTRSFEELWAEAEKCVLLCANCHAEVENGHASIDQAA